MSKVLAGWMIAVAAALSSLALGQEQPGVTLRTTVPLVLAPTTVVDRSGRVVTGLAASDFLLLDDGVAQRVYLEEEAMPISLVIAAQATVEARKALHRLRQTIGLIEPLVTGHNGEAALLAIRDDVEEVVPFTADGARVAQAVRKMEARGAGCSLVDAVMRSAELLRSRPGGRRRVVLVVAESRDRTSQSGLSETLAELQKANVTVYALSYSPFLMEFGREVPLDGA